MIGLCDALVIEFKREDVAFIENTLRASDGKTHVVCGKHLAVIVQNQMENDYNSNLIVAYTECKELKWIC